MSDKSALKLDPGGLCYLRVSRLEKNDVLAIGAARSTFPWFGGAPARNGSPYPRWVQIEGRQYRVKSRADEQRLLQAIMARARPVEPTHIPTRAKAEKPRVTRKIKARAPVKPAPKPEPRVDIEALRKADQRILLAMG